MLCHKWGQVYFQFVYGSSVLCTEVTKRRHHGTTRISVFTVVPEHEGDSL